ncbi:MAG: sulfite exporter TauE/SafE family protein [Alphaproteobacteria bacterium]|nr:sulfite exporter TauE/SafE family protein [Alphaproteobacteria bacterium]
MEHLIFSFLGTGVGFFLGLTGTGGSILAVPLLLALTPLSVKEAFFFSLVMVALVSCVGALRQGLLGNVQWRKALIFSGVGMVVAPLVLHVTQRLPETLHVMLFTILMLGIACRMFAGSKIVADETPCAKPFVWNPRSALKVGAGGVIVGALSGLFGVGSGFLIVPLLTDVFKLSYRHAVGTSLASITLVSSAAILEGCRHGLRLDPMAGLYFFLGGIIGLLGGGICLHHVAEDKIKKIFAVTLILLSLYTIMTHYPSQGEILHDDPSRTDIL